MDDTENDLTSLRCRRAVSRYRYSNVEKTSTWLITKTYASVRKIEKTAESLFVRKKHRALKTCKIEEDIAIKSHFKPIIEPLQKIVDNSSIRVIKDEPRDNDDDDVKTLSVQKREEDVKQSKRKRSNTSLDRKSKRLDAPGLASPIISTPSATTVQPAISESLANELFSKPRVTRSRKPFKISCKRWRIKKH